MCPLWPLKIYEPDHHVAAGFVEDVAWVKDRSVRCGRGIASYRGSGGFAAENLPGVEVGGLEVGYFNNYRIFHYFHLFMLCVLFA